jgi:hypothetical protein
MRKTALAAGETRDCLRASLVGFPLRSPAEHFTQEVSKIEQTRKLMLTTMILNF